MVKTLLAAAVAVTLASSGAFAADVSKKPVKMTDAQLATVTAGQNCSIVSCVDVEVDVRNNDIVKNVVVAANAAIAVLGRAGAGQGVSFTPQP